MGEVIYFGFKQICGCVFISEDGDPLDQFSVTAAGEEWTVISKSPLDREDKDRYNLKIIATDGRFQTSANVEIHVLDLNDNSPLCEQVSQIFSRDICICVLLQLWTLCLCGHGRHLTLKLGGGKKNFFFLDVAYALNNALHCNALCQYSAVKNNLKRLPAFTKLWNFDSCC